MTHKEESLTEIVNRETLLDLAGSKYFERGEDYYERSLVLSLLVDKEGVSATVRGTEDYEVELWIEGGELTGSCSCPLGEDGQFCKHCVALGLAWIDALEDGDAAAEDTVSMEDVRGYLAGLEKEALVEMVIKQVRRDAQLRQELLVRAAKSEGRGVDLQLYRRLVDQAVGRADFVEYRQMHGFAQGIQKVVDEIEELLSEGHAAEVVELVEYALKAVEQAAERVDDSDGYMGGILARLEDLHLKACEEAKPDPEELARILFDWEVHGPYDTFADAMDTYAEVLGEKGLAVYRELAEEAWKRMPQFGPGDGMFRSDQEFDRVQSIMELFASDSGDIEQLVEIESRNLSSPYRFLRIAQIYKQSGEHDKALEWAEKGLQAFPERPDQRIQDFVAEEYHRGSRHDEAMELMWAQFKAYPHLGSYRTLKEHAERAGKWPEWRQKALAFMREEASKRRPTTLIMGGGQTTKPDVSRVVEILLWEDKVEDAWKEAEAASCSSDLWLEMADKRKREHPEDSLRIYQTFVKPTVEQGDYRSYEEAVTLLRKINELMLKLGRREEFLSYLETIRTEYKRRRNLMQLLDQAKWKS